MKVGFPYMGDLQVPLAAVMSGLGAEVVKPPRLDARILAVGTRLSPEGMCIPFKATLGVMERNLALGADTLIYSSGYWSCRFGYYGLLQSAILRDLGYSFRRFELHVARLSQLVREAVALSDGSSARMAVRALRARADRELAAITIRPGLLTTLTTGLEERRALRVTSHLPICRPIAETRRNPVGPDRARPANRELYLRFELAIGESLRD